MDVASGLRDEFRRSCGLIKAQLRVKLQRKGKVKSREIIFPDIENGQIRQESLTYERQQANYHRVQDNESTSRETPHNPLLDRLRHGRQLTTVRRYPLGPLFVQPQ